MRCTLIALAGFTFISGCDEIGSDPNGPYKALMRLRDEAGEQREFYLGGYKSFGECARLIEFEAEELKDDTFWTNPQFDYGGGGPTKDDWIEHTVVEISCRYSPSE